VCDVETSRIGAPYIYDISNLRVNTIVLLRMSTVLLETCRGFKYTIIEETVRQVGYLPELYEDAQSEKY
jgi:hypothetical protein